MVDGQPADGAIVYFCPLSGPNEVRAERPFGMTDSQGEYQLTTFEKGDGAPAGEYNVVIQWPSDSGTTDERQGRRTMGPDRLKGKYFNLSKSTISATVQEQSNEIPPFELTSR